MRILSLLCLCAAVVAISVQSPAVHADPHHRPSPGPLAGKRILLSPGHGWTWQNSSLFWYTQRGVVNGMVEDFSNAMLVNDFLAPYLINAGADVVTPRERSYQRNEFIGDDGDASWSQTGTWTASSNVSGFWGTGYRWANVSATQTALAAWEFAVTDAGNYPVYVRFTAGSDRAADALYRVHHAAGIAEVTVDQRTASYTNPYDSVTETVSQGGRWVYIGEWAFTPASGIRVELSNQSSTAGAVVIADAVKVGGGMGSIDRGGGVTGRPRWEECSRYYAEFHGMPSSVWDIAGSDDGSDNVGTPSRLLKWWGDFDLHLAVHSNASGQTPPSSARGTVTYTYDNSSTPHPAALLADSVAFATLVQDEAMRVNNAWAASRGDTWTDRGLNSANFGELRQNNKTPACLIEMAFHDNIEDTWYLRNPRWRHDTARALYKAIVRFFNPAATIMPLPPTHLRALNTGAGEITLSWQAQADALEPAATPTGYRVYLSSDGISFDGGRDANGSTAHTLTGLTPGQLVFARVTAVNAGGESLWSEVTCARTPSAAAQGLATPLLLVAGYDRLDEFTWYQQGATNRTGDMHVRNHGDAVVRHALAAANATTSGGGSYFFDGASNEAVANGAVPLAGYGLVDYVLGNESTVDETFSATERGLVDAYVAGGGRLFVTGAEVGWDIGRSGASTAAEVAFYNGALGAAYVSDDSGDYTVTATSGGVFDGVPAFTFDDGTGNSYTVNFPDVIAVSGGSVAALEYGPGVLAGVAGTQAITFGFPFETINEAAARNAIMQAVLRTSLPTYTGDNGGTPPPPPGGGSGDSDGGGSNDEGGGCALTRQGQAAALAFPFALALYRRRRRTLR